VAVRVYLVVFGALLGLTLVTLGVQYLPLGTGAAVGVGLAIAAVKAALVAWFFMHLASARVLVHAALGLTAVLFAALFGMMLWAEAGHIQGTRFAPPFDEGIR
jgi:cytochrome c oxidase subunit IV